MLTAAQIKNGQQNFVKLLHTDYRAVVHFVLKNNPQSFYQSLRKYINGNNALNNAYGKDMTAVKNIDAKHLKTLNGTVHTLLDTQAIAPADWKNILLAVPYVPNQANFTSKASLWDALGLEPGDFHGLINQNNQF